MKLPRRMALLMGALTALLALFALRATGRAELPLLLVLGSLVLIAAGLLRPRDQAGRTRVVAAWGVYAAAMLVAVALAWLQASTQPLALVTAGLFLIGLGMTMRAAYQAPRRRERIYARYLKSSSETF